MAELSSRARATAAQMGRLSGEIAKQRTDFWLDTIGSLGPLSRAVRVGIVPTGAEVHELLFSLAVLTGLWGYDITEATESAILRREMGLRKVLPGTTPPVPDAKANDGTMRDKATGNATPLES